jgi:hypothetical protein
MNSKIAGIVAGIEYRIPAGTIDEYKYGVRIKRATPTQEATPQLISSETISSGIRELKHEMQKPFKTSETLREPELIK